MKNINISLVQPNIMWENKSGNFEKYEKLVSGLTDTDLIIFPEMFTTGFSMRPEKLKETMKGGAVAWMKNLATQKNASVTGSLIIEAEGKVMNRLVWVFPDGSIRLYDKRHLFTMGEENNHYSAGTEKLILEYKGWKFCPLVCYDLRFPVWSRNIENYDVLIYVANWPAPRHEVWRTLLQARAIENQVYCIGVNRVGTDGPGLNYLGDSVVISPKGYPAYLGREEEVKTFELSYDDLYDFRKKFPVLDDRDNFVLT